MNLKKENRNYRVENFPLGKKLLLSDLDLKYEKEINEDNPKLTNNELDKSILMEIANLHINYNNSNKIAKYVIENANRKIEIKITNKRRKSAKRSQINKETAKHNPWIIFLRKYAKKHPELKGKSLLQEARKYY
jgi:hypothetical protein